MSISECHVINDMIWYCTITNLVKTADKRWTPGKGAHLGEHRQRWIGRPGDRKVPFSSPPILIEFLFIKTTDGIDSVLAKLGQILNLLLIRLPCDRKSGSFPFLSQLNSTQLNSAQLNSTAQGMRDSYSSCRWSEKWRCWRILNDFRAESQKHVHKGCFY